MRRLSTTTLFTAHRHQVLVSSALVLLSVVLASRHQVSAQQHNVTEFLREYNHDIIAETYAYKKLKYKLYTDYTPLNEKTLKEHETKHQRIVKEYQRRAAQLNLDGVDEASSRQIMFINSSMTSTNPYVNENLFRLKRRMEKAFQEARVKHNPNVIKSVKPPNGEGSNSQNDTAWHMSLIEMNNIMANLHASPEEKLFIWKGFRDALGPEVRKDYLEFVRFKNIAARENGYADAGAYKRRDYEVDNLEEIAEDFWQELQPFYQELHAYVRFRLSQQKDDGTTNHHHFKRDGPMPAHLLGNMWALTWDGVYDHIKPYPDEPAIDITAGLKRKYKNTTEMFKATEDFFRSIGWPTLPPNFWNNSVLSPPPEGGKKVTCHPTAWDMYGTENGRKDLRLIMCAQQAHNHFITAHHEVGHLYYGMLYWNLPFQFREGANPAFHEAVGDTLSLSVQVPKHLYDIGLLQSVSSTKENDINYLLKTAVETVTFMPYAYILDKWVWNVYNGNINASEMNAKWWEMRLKYQGVKPPVERTEADLDPATKYHMTADVPYIRYFFAVILQFTFHKYACKAANHTGNLHQCSIYNSKAAGKAFGDMLKLGRSKPWPEQLKQFTGSEKLSADPILDYFAPLRDWLKKQQAEHKYPVGWEVPGDKVTTGHSKSNANSIKCVSCVLLFLSVLLSLLTTVE